MFAPHEFANANPAALAARVRAAPYAAAFRAAFSAPGADVFDDAAHVVAWLAMALEVYQQSAADFYPYTSKYDAFLRGQARLSAPELHGLALFNDPAKGNCANCHPSSIGSGSAFPRFTDSAYAALGVPRNPRLPANRDPRHFDLGLCGPDRHDLVDHPEYCGRFKTPTLRNVATRRVFFHNGVFDSLQQVIEFYVQRDTAPQRWYARDAQGRVQKFDDLPPSRHANVNTEAPFGGRPGEQPRLSAAEIRYMIAFLQTLSDGYSPAAGVERNAAP